MSYSVPFPSHLQDPRTEGIYLFSRPVGNLPGFPRNHITLGRVRGANFDVISAQKGSLIGGVLTTEEMAAGDAPEILFQASRLRILPKKDGSISDLMRSMEKYEALANIAQIPYGLFGINSGSFLGFVLFGAAHEVGFDFSVDKQDATPFPALSADSRKFNSDFWAWATNTPEPPSGQATANSIAGPVADILVGEITNTGIENFRKVLPLVANAHAKAFLAIKEVERAHPAEQDHSTLSDIVRRNLQVAREFDVLEYAQLYAQLDADEFESVQPDAHGTSSWSDAAGSYRASIEETGNQLKGFLIEKIDSQGNAINRIRFNENFVLHSLTKFASGDSGTVVESTFRFDSFTRELLLSSASAMENLLTKAEFRVVSDGYVKDVLDISGTKYSFDRLTGTLSVDGEVEIRLPNGGWLENAGGQIGSIIGGHLATSNEERFAYRTVLNAFLSNVGEEIGNAISGVTDNAWADLDVDLGRAATSSLGSIVVGELQGLLGIEKTVPSSVFTAITQPVVNSFISKAFSGSAGMENPLSRFGDLGHSHPITGDAIPSFDIDAFLGNLAVSVATSVVISKIGFADTKEEMIASQIGGTIGSYAGSALGPIGSAVGQIIGSAIGAFIGGLFVDRESVRHHIANIDSDGNVADSFRIHGTRVDDKPRSELRYEAEGVADALSLVADALGGDLTRRIDTGLGSMYDRRGQNYLGGSDFRRFGHSFENAYAHAINSAVAQMRRHRAARGADPFSWHVLDGWELGGEDARSVVDLLSDLETAQQFLFYIANRDELQEMFEEILPVPVSDGGATPTGQNRVRGTENDDSLQGGVDETSDTFDSDAGGSDTLDGGLGDDTYHLGLGTDNDLIDEGTTGGGADRIWVESVALADGVEIKRIGDDLVVRLLDGASSLTVKGQFRSGESEQIVERLQFAKGGSLVLSGLVIADGDTRVASDLLALSGTSGADTLDGTSESDVFDSDGDSDVLRGAGGDDIYYLRVGTGADTVDEDRAGGGGDDRIYIKEGLDADKVQLSRSGLDLKVSLLDVAGETTGDSLLLKGHFKSEGSGGIERLVFAGKGHYLLERLALSEGESMLASKLGLSSAENSFILGWAATLARALELGLEISLLREAGALGTENRNDFPGSEASDLYLGLGGNDILDGRGGKDQLYGGSGSDILKGGGGDDRLYGGADDDELLGGLGNDLLLGERGSDVLHGGLGNDRLEGGVDSDELRGGEGDDILVGDLDDSLLDGGDGVADTLLVESGVGVHVDLDSGAFYEAGSASGESELVIGVEQVAGSRFDDVLLGDENANVLTGLLGDDDLSGREGDDIYVFGYRAGRDRVTESANGGVDTLRFANGASQDRDLDPRRDVVLRIEGDDLVVMLQDYQSRWVNAEFHQDWVYRNAEHRRWAFDDLADGVTIAGWESATRPVERFEFGDVTHTWDELYALASDVQLIGSDDGETLTGRDGSRIDTLEVSGPLLRGTPGRDVLVGSTGNDAFRSDLGGDDTLEGGAGSDLYYLGPGTGQDTIDEDRSGAGGTDRIRVVSGWSSDDVRLRRDGDDLVVILLGYEGVELDSRYVVRNHFGSAGDRARVETLDFEDGGHYDLSQLSLQTGNAALVASLTESLALHDTLEGGKGDDTLRGGGGADVYVFNRGDGSDTVEDHLLVDGTAVDAGQDTLLMGSGTSLTDIVLSHDGTHLGVGLKKAGTTVFNSLPDRVQLSQWSDLNRRVEWLAFRDGTRVRLSDLLSAHGVGSDGTAVWLDGAMADADETAGAVIVGTGGSDILVAGDGLTRLAGGAGGDELRVSDDFEGGLAIDGGGGIDTADFRRLSAAVEADLGAGTFRMAVPGDAWRSGTLAGIEQLAGGAGDDTLTGSAGADLLRGGDGDDTLSGGAGDDVYLFSRGDGADSLSDSGGRDVLLFDGTVHIWDLWLGHGANGALELRVRDSWGAPDAPYDDLGQSITISGWDAAASDRPVDELRFSDNVLFRRLSAQGNPVRLYAGVSDLASSGVPSSAVTSLLALAGGTTADSLDMGALVGWARRHGLADNEPLRLGNAALMAELLSVADLPPDLQLPPDSAPRSPLVLDLDGDGVETTAKAVFFDHDGDGHAEWTAMSGADDGLLALDLDGSGAIESGRELFGTGTLVGGRQASHGFEALSRLDSNGDGRVDRLDARWSDLRVMRWSDGDGDGHLETSRLQTMAQAGVASLDLDFSVSDHVDRHGNEHRYTGTHTTTSGASRAMTDVWFGVSTEYSTQTAPASLPAAVSALPFLGGSGKVSRLDAAMVSDTALRMKVGEFGAAAMRTNRAAREAKLDEIIFQWTGGTSLTAAHVGAKFNKMDTRAQHAVESFLGRQWLQGRRYRRPQYVTAARIQQTWHELREWVSAGLMIQTHLSDLYALVDARTDRAGNFVGYDFARALSALDGEGGARFGEFVRALTALSRDDPALATSLSSHARLAQGYRYHSEQFTNLAFERVRHHRSGRLTEVGEVYGWDARTHDRDILIGRGSGVDTLHGASGNDVYLLEKGIGHDVIDEGKRNRRNTYDEVWVAPGIAASEVTLSRTGDDLVISLGATSGAAAPDSLRVKNHFSSQSRYRVERVVFGDGSSWGRDRLDTAGAGGLVSPFTDTVADETHSGNGQPNLMDASVGGDDLLRGGAGADRYALGAGTGSDTVDEEHGNRWGDDGDAVVLKEGVRLSALRLSRTRTDLVLSLSDGDTVTDSLTVRNHYVSAAARVEHVLDHEGREVLDAAALGRVELLDAGDGAADGVVTGSDRFGDHIGQESGAQVLRGGGGDDTYRFGFGAGSDTVEDNVGANTVELGSGVRSVSQVALERSHADLFIVLVDSEGARANRLKVTGHFSAGSLVAVRLADGTELSAEALGLARLVDDSDGDSTVDGLAGWVADRFADQAGAQVLRGGWGNDAYFVGSGADTVVETGNGRLGDANDRLVAEGWAEGDAALSRTRYDLKVSFGSGGDSVTVRDHFRSSSRRVERLEFGDGAVWDAGRLAEAELLDDGDGDATVDGSDGFGDRFGAAAGAQVLRGGRGDDTYLLGAGSGDDAVDESHGNTGLGDGGDTVLVAAGLEPSSVRTVRVGDDLLLEALGADGAPTASLRVRRHFADARARVERVVFDSGESWRTDRLPSLARLWEAAPGAQTLRGGGGVDIYEVGVGSGFDTVDEVYRNNGDNAGADIVRVAGALGTSRVSVRRTRTDLVVEVLGASGRVTDRLTVQDHYWLESARVERLEFGGGTVWDGARLDEVALTGSGTLTGVGGGASDLFDGGTGADTYRGMGGDDVYVFGDGSGSDVVDEGYGNRVEGDAGDAVRLRAGTVTSRVSLSRTATDLVITLNDASGTMTDRLTVRDHYAHPWAAIERVERADGSTLHDAADFAAVAWTPASPGTAPLPIRGMAPSEILNGTAGADVFDSDAGGNDTLRGRTGDDIYWLGRGTGMDMVDERTGNSGDGDAGDEIRLKAGIGVSDVRLWRDQYDLHVDVLTDGSVTDRLKVDDFYRERSARVERVVFADGTEWGAAKLLGARIRGTAANDFHLQGASGRSDVFDSDAGGNDTLRGQGGDDIYWLGRGTGTDTIDERSGNSGDGDAGDEIRLKAGIGVSDVRLWRDWRHLYVDILDDGAMTDRLKVSDHHSHRSARVERVVFADGTELGEAELMAAPFRGTAGNDTIDGSGDTADHFDGDAGGNDRLRGQEGDDVYWLGRGTGQDTIDEGWGNTGVGDLGDEIRLKAGIGVSDVRLWREQLHLHVEILTGGSVSDRMTVENYYLNLHSRVERLVFSDGSEWGEAEFTAARFHGTAGNESLYGRNDLADHFDSDAGGNDWLRGRQGDDVYWLGRGTGMDTVDESAGNSGDGDTGDEIRLKEGITASDVRLWRDHLHLHVGILTGGTVSDRLTVNNFYLTRRSRIERLVFADGSGWGEARFDTALLHGTTANEFLYGRDDLADHFDSDAGGNDWLRGRQGDDVYWLGRGTGMDTIDESAGNSGDGDTGDEIRLKEGITASDVRLWRDRHHLHVGILTDGTVSDRLTVNNHYFRPSARVERLVFADGAVWDLSERAGRILAPSTGTVLEGDANDNLLRGSGGQSLHGKAGDDTYVLGGGTGVATVDERVGNSGAGDAGDSVRVDGGFGVSDVRLSRSRDDLHIGLLGAAGSAGVRTVTDSLRIAGHFAGTRAQVESLVFADGTVLDFARLAQAEIRASHFDGSTLDGLARFNDVFGSDPGVQTLRGLTGDDVYVLAEGGGLDVVDESHGNTGLGDPGDHIRLAPGLDASRVRLRRDASHLHVQVLDAAGSPTGDAIKVSGHFTSEAARIEWVALADGAVLWSGGDFDGAARIYDTSGGAVTGTAGDDTYHLGDAGASEIRGGDGDDTYVLGRGGGRDRVRESSSATDTGGMWDTVVLEDGIAPGDVRLVRDGNSLKFVLLGAGGAAGGDELTVVDHFLSEERKVEALVFADGSMWDWDVFGRAPLTGGAGNDVLTGLDTFGDTLEAGAGEDTLRGGGGDDTYLFGEGAGRARIEEGHRRTGDGDGGDRITLDAHGAGDVRAYRGSSDLWLALIDENGRATASVTVRRQFGTVAAAKVESVEFGNGDIWALDLLDSMRVSTSGGGVHTGRARFSDTFASASGDATLRGGSGNDVYVLARGGGDDTIQEAHGNAGGSRGDVIRVAAGIAKASVRLEKSGDDLVVRIPAAGGAAAASMRVDDQFSNTAARIESIEVDGAVLLERNFQALIDELAAFRAGTSAFGSESQVLNHYWEDAAQLVTPVS